MKMIRTLPKQKERVETGVTRFRDDWPGLFIRGDDCLRYALSLSNVLDSDYGGEVYDRATLQSLLDWLKETNMNGAASIEVRTRLLLLAKEQQERIEAAKAALVSRWDSQGACASCGWHAALDEHGVDDGDIAEALQLGGMLELGCLNPEGDSWDHRGVTVALGESDDNGRN